MPVLSILAPAVNPDLDRIPLATDLAAAWQSDGWEAGAPDHLKAWAKESDAFCVAAMICPGCDRRGLVARFFHNGNRVCILAVCTRCGCGEEA